MKKVWIVIWGLVNFAFSGFLAQPLTKFIKEQFSDDSTKKWEWLLGDRFSLLSFLVFCVLFLLVLGIVLLIWNLAPKNKKKRQNDYINAELKNFNSMDFPEEKVKATWEVYPESIMNDNPFIANLQFFCMNESHSPVRMQGGSCPYNNCPNHMRTVNEYNFKNIIESELILRKKELKDKSR